MYEKWKEEDKRAFYELKLALHHASDLRTFPNGRDLPIDESIAINNLGKVLDAVTDILNRIQSGEKQGLAALVGALREGRLKFEKKLAEIDYCVEQSCCKTCGLVDSCDIGPEVYNGRMTVTWCKSYEKKLEL
jgi:hypothetical protein